jgi:hypothetical protein
MEFTEQERRLLGRVRDANRWDSLWWELSYLVPSLIIVGIGIWNSSDVVAFTGIAVFLFFRARFEIHQAKQFPVFKGLCEKIEAMTTANKASDATSEPAPGAGSSSPQG